MCAHRRPERSGRRTPRQRSSSTNTSRLLLAELQGAPRTRGAGVNAAYGRRHVPARGCAVGEPTNGQRPLPGPFVAGIGLPQRRRRPPPRSAAGSASSWRSWTDPVHARSRSLAVGEAALVKVKTDPARAHGGDEPVLASDQVLAVPAARPGHAGRLLGRRRGSRDSGRARRRSLDLDDAPDLVVIQVYITSAQRAYRDRGPLSRSAAHTWRWADCT